MIQECYYSLGNLVAKMQEQIKCLIEGLKKNDSNNDAITLIQQCIIDLGNELEQTFHLENLQHEISERPTDLL